MKAIVAVVSAVLWASAAHAETLPALGTTYTQEFNTLVFSAPSSFLPVEWMFTETGTSANATYVPSTGSLATGNTYSFGGNNAGDRALGMVRADDLVSTIGTFFVNGTGQTVTRLDVSYIGEQWRLGATGREDRIDFAFSTDAAGLTTGTWTDVDTLDFSTVSTGSVGFKDGNSSQNRRAVADAITGLSIAPGATFWIRWTDFDADGADDGLAVDGFRLTPSAPAPVPAATAVPLPGAAWGGMVLGGMFALARRSRGPGG
jgi:hypothetical protein